MGVHAQYRHLVNRLGLAAGANCRSLPEPRSGKDAAALLEAVRARVHHSAELWILGYASLIWRPEFEFVEHRRATVHGWHRALRMRSRVNRGTPERPGLVFALVAGGSCRGMVYRVAPERAQDELERLWAREMPTGVYDPRWLPCRTATGTRSGWATQVPSNPSRDSRNLSSRTRASATS